MLDCAVLFVCKGIDVEEFQRFDEGNEFLVAEIADVEVGELLAQEISQGTRENPAVVVGIFFGQLDERLTDGGEIFPPVSCRGGASFPAVSADGLPAFRWHDYRLPAFRP